ncbi:MAG TPA: outer membrane beta-barrel protein [Brumimicrobium sp.]|nr:outer membrane beta-barrel protein [Brumimicrobium sp.]
MILNKHIFLLAILLLGITNAFAQSYRPKPENFFGLQAKPLIPFGLVGDKPFTIQSENYKATISPTLGYSYGAVVRVGLTELLALETGLNYTRRNFRADHSVADSNVMATDYLGFVSFDIPVNFLVYIKLGQNMFMNVAGGASANFNASNVRSHVVPDDGKHIFVFEGKRLAFFDFNANADVGFEYRTEKSGTFYLGVTARIPFKPNYQIATAYQYDTYKLVDVGFVDGATFALNLKYFFFNTKVKKGPQFKGGPIEQ